MIQVETFEIEEATVGADGVEAPPVDAEAIALARSLGLEGQESLVVKKDEPEAKEERLPYPEMNAQERVVYGELFPQRTEVRKYDAGIIPIRVLQVIGHARELFEKLEVWHPRIHNPDPILIGVIGQKCYLLARWGSALRPFADLVEDARRTMTASVREKLEACRAECNEKLAGIDALVSKMLRGEWVHVNF